jgi:hypothetical protein
MKIYYFSAFLILFLLIGNNLTAGTDLKINPKLRYSSDSNDGPLITGRDLDDAKLSAEKPTHVILYHRQCYNSKRQAKRTVELYDKFKEKVNFIVIDLDEISSRDQVGLKQKYYTNYIPHVTIINKEGKVVYDRAGEVSTDKLSDILESEINKSS